jgi:hypothetical protein
MSSERTFSVYLVFTIAVNDVHCPAGMIRVSDFHGELAGVDSGFHVFFEGDNKLNPLLINGKGHFAVEEAMVNN